MTTGSSPPYRYGRHWLDDDDIAAALGTLKTEWLTQGPKLEALESAFAAYCGARYCLAVASGTAGLHMACAALEIHGKAGWTSALSFVASANAVRYAGGSVDFLDIDLSTFNVTPALLEQKLADAAVPPAVVIPVHFAGQSCDMEGLRKASSSSGARIIEDACHALGGSYHGGKIGNCAFSDITVFSLHPVKSITSGEGGLVTTNDETLYARMKRFRAHGLSKDPAAPPWQVEMAGDGYNYRITEFQCALALSQLGKVDRFIEKRHTLVERYRRNLAGLPLRFQVAAPGTQSAWHLLVLLIDYPSLGLSKLEFFDDMARRGVQLSVHYLPIPRHRFYQAFGFGTASFPNADAYYEQAFSYPLHPGLEVADVDYITEQIRAGLLAATSSPSRL